MRLRIVVGTVLAVAVATLFLYGHDRARSDQIADGIRIAGVDVGGMSSAEAIAAVNRRTRPMLSGSIVASHGADRFTLRKQTARTRLNVRRVVDEAIARSRRGTFVSRGLRSLTGGQVDATLAPRPTYSKAAVRSFIRDIERAVEHSPRNARVRFSGNSVSVVASHDGRSVRTDALAASLNHELTRLGGSARIRVPTKVARPDVATDELPDRYPLVITVDRPRFKLRVFRRLKPWKTYSVSIGQVGFDTPGGLYSIQNKAVDPVWSVPDEDWAGELRGRAIPPGPKNPIKSRWMGIYDGAGIHGTDQEESIGTRASRGCIRMRISDVKDLYPRVQVGAPIYIE